jgi:hypothetical protein
MSNGHPMRHPDDVARDEALIRWLAKRDPDEWHRVAQSWNWDRGHMPLRWIIQQADCDRATALLVFWRTDASYYLRYGHRDEIRLRSQREIYDLLCEIRQNWMDGKYRRSEIAYDPVADGFAKSMDAERKSLGPRLKFVFPREMERAVAGRELNSADYEDGLPPQFAAQLRRH